MKVVFFGTPSFAASVLSYLLDHGVDVVAVVTRQDKPKGRSDSPVSPPVKEYIASHAPHIPLLQPEKASSPEFADLLSSYHADLFVVVAYGEILKQFILDIPRLACINLHASLLPKFRGAAPIQRAIIAGEKKTGVTIMHMVKKMDAGNMIEKAEVSIEENATFGDVERKLCSVGAELLAEVISRFAAGVPAEEVQDEAMATFAPKVELEDCRIDWQRSSREIHNLVRGVTPYPGAWCEVEVKGAVKRLKIKSSRVVEFLSGQPGEILSLDSEGLVVACGSQALRIVSLQLEGKRMMTPEELMRGTSFTFKPDSQAIQG